MEFLKSNLDLVTLGFILSCYIGAINTQNNNLVLEVQNTTENEPIIPVVKVHKCTTSKLPTGHELVVPSYGFNDEVTLKVKEEAFSDCDRYGVQLETTTLWWNKEYNITNYIDEIEINETSISPIGVLNVKGHFYFPDEYCLHSATNIDEPEPIIIFEYCPVNCSNPPSEAEIRRPCIKKCCPFGKSVDVNTSGPADVAEGCSITSEEIWTGFFYDEYTWKRISDSELIVNKVKPHFFRHILQCKIYHRNETEDINPFLWYRRNLNSSLHSRQLTKLLTNGQLLYISLYRRYEPLKDVDFCIDGFQDIWTNGIPYEGNEEDQVLALCEDIAEQESSKELSISYMVCLFGASAFYLLTAIVYALLWDKHNTHGWTVFSLVTSLFFFVVFLGNAHRLGLDGSPGLRGSNLCIANAILAHFFMLATFTWLSLISFDVWWTFRELKPQNKKSLKKFYFYLIIGIGLPLTVVIVGITLEKLYPETESLVQIPEYGDQICFVARWAQGVYIYYIIACLLAINVILTILTFLKLYGFQRDTSKARSQSSAGDRKMFDRFMKKLIKLKFYVYLPMTIKLIPINFLVSINLFEIIVYLKLLVILGTSWIFEYISWQASDEDHQHWIWTIFDFYNFFTAVLIFIIFICKETIMDQLEDKYPKVMTPVLNVFRKLRDQQGAVNTSKGPTSSSGSTGLTAATGDHKLKSYGTNSKGFKNSSKSEADVSVSK